MYLTPELGIYNFNGVSPPAYLHKILRKSLSLICPDHFSPPYKKNNILEKMSDFSDSAYDSDEWEETTTSWNSLVVLPRGINLSESVRKGDTLEWVYKFLRRHFAAKYPDKTPKFRFELRRDIFGKRWYVTRQCPCGTSMCTMHVHPKEVQFEGVPKNVCDAFRQYSCMTVSEARDKLRNMCPPGDIVVNPTTVTFLRRVAWQDILDIPPNFLPRGHTHTGRVKQDIERYFGSAHENGVKKFRVTFQDGKYTVRPQCACGNIESCPNCVFPYNVNIERNFALILKRRNEPVRELEEEFRKVPALPWEDAVAWFMSIGLRWQVDKVAIEGASELTYGLRIRMLCNCKKPSVQVPCDSCHKKMLAPCAKCSKMVPKRSLKKGTDSLLCQKCHHEEVIACPHCKGNVTRGHVCVPIPNQHITDKPHHRYPPCVRQKGSKMVICPDCGKGMQYNIYHRHQQREHGLPPEQGGIPACGLYTRDHPMHKCLYCNYRSADSHLVRQHQLRHDKLPQYPCRHGCGERFTRLSAEITHVKEYHDGEDVQSAHTRVIKRKNGKIHTVSKKRRRTGKIVMLRNVAIV